MSTTTRRTLIFHIGDHKTGSTSIQTVFAGDRVRFKSGRAYFSAKLSHNWLKEHCNAYGAENRRGAKANAEKVFRNIAADIQRANAEFCLISAESLEGVPAHVLKDIIDRFFSDTADDIRVVAYVRPHAGRFTSGFTERTKTGLPNALSSDLDRLFDIVMENGTFLYAPRFLSWRAQFGDRFILRPMIRDQLYQGSVVEDFILHAFGTKDFTVVGEAGANESLCLEDLMRLKALQSYILKSSDPRLRHAIGWEFSRVVNQMQPPETPTKLRLHKSLAEKIYAAYLDDAREMDREFFEGAPLLAGDLERTVETAIPRAQSTEPADHLSQSEMRSLEVFSRIIAGLLESEETNWPAFLRSKRIRDIKKTRIAAKAAQ
ncbi:hypothetical protein [Sedimentitalea todarodis]|uniref:Uncharacterized protein n=1 Tax=Sedimentitalea todarodis TaxID=1631240 RepID=A0ABU3VK49_9RHOB|nr:hypothetical protein [Sedimentitalea todarodis]MDU9006558.1 hypothetical protein [Sedimentitalea todarodis]